MRLAEVRDLDALRNMLIEDNEEDYIPDIIDKWVEDRGTYVATDGEEILGMAHKHLSPDGSLWLGGLRVRNSARRRGVGRVISNFMVNLPDSNVYRLLIDEENEASIGLTLKTGFTQRLIVSLWVSGNSHEDMEVTELGEDSVKLRPGDYFGGMGSLLATAWYAFELNERALLVASDFGLKFVTDRGRNVYLFNEESRSITPVILRKRSMLSEIPEGTVLFGRANDDFTPQGFDQSLWASRVVIFEYIRKGALH